ncbi:RING-H2 finger protein ATL21A [Populus alba x Populus x berolinensis]|nr:RING-H2 finger protein ATL21A [Populus alba x Populus x berolinensis]
MDLSVVCLLMLVLVCHGAGLNETFREEKCKKHGPAIRFPFRLDKQPEYFGYDPGFVLSCNERKETLLQLPTSVTLNIKKIDYKLRLIIAAAPDNCFPRQLRNFSLSKSPFKFAGDYPYDYALFNCTSKHGDFYDRIPCLGGPGYDIYAYSSNNFLGYTDLTSCTKMYNVTSIPSEMIDRDILHLNWSEPAACVGCEAHGKFCRWKNKTKLGTECYEKPKSKKGKIRKIEGAGEISANLEVLELFPYLSSSELS